MTTLQKIREEIEQIATNYDNFEEYRRVRGLWIALNIIDKYAKQEPKSPCDLCMYYNPPSSCDEKPCTMCPAEKGSTE